MTNYNERLDELRRLYRCIMHDFNDGEDREDMWLREIRLSITSLIKELVAEAKPKNNWLEGSDLFYGHDEGVGEFEQNLLKALEEV